SRSRYSITDPIPRLRYAAATPKGPTWSPSRCWQYPTTRPPEGPPVSTAITIPSGSCPPSSPREAPDPVRELRPKVLRQGVGVGRGEEAHRYPLGAEAGLRRPDLRWPGQVVEPAAHRDRVSFGPKPAPGQEGEPVRVGVPIDPRRVVLVRRD